MNDRLGRTGRAGAAVAALVLMTASLVGIVLAAGPAAAASFSNPASITIPDASCSGTPGQASIYPTNITVSGVTGTVSKVTVTLNNLTSDFEGDPEVLLVGPAGGTQNLELLSDAGTGVLTNQTITFDDASAFVPPQNTAWGTPNTTITAKPTNYTELSGADVFPAPAPTPSSNTTLASAFNGINPNGTWSLYIIDDACGDGPDTLAGGWSLDITTVSGAATTTTVTSSPNPSRTGTPVTFTATVTSGGSPVSTGTVTFAEGGVILAAGVAVNASGMASFSTSALTEGTHAITASYNGTAAFNVSSGTIGQRVDNNTTVTGSTYCNTGPITIPGTGVNGNAGPYPSNIFVTGFGGTVGKVMVSLKNVSHSFAGDIDALLVGPAGQNLALVSDAGTSAVSNVTVNFDDAAASKLPQNGSWAAPNATISAQPTDYVELVADNYPVPAPAPSAATTLATFNNTDPNGTWSLYVVDDGAPDTGSIAGGWCLTLTAAKASPTISTQASGNVTIGSAVRDVATVAGGVSPTGTVTFKLFGPSDTNCAGTAVFTSTTALSAGTATSGDFTASTAGAYRWTALYNGDTANNPATSACNDANESVTVNQVQPTVTTTASAGGPLGTAIHDTAVLAGGVNPTGSIIFNLYGPDNATCTAPSKFIDTVTVNGNGTYPSASFTPTAPGVYRWTASYVGDGNNTPTNTLCNDANESATIGKASPSISTQASATVAVGGTIRDVATLGGGSSPTGTVAFRLFGPNDTTCASPAVFTSTNALAGGVATSGDFTAASAGTYRWTAVYSGDANNDGVTSACNAPNESVSVTKANPSITTTASSGLTIGGQVSDTASLAGGLNPTGTITFNLYGPNDATCSSAATFTSSGAVAGNGTYTSGGFVPAAPGTYRWTAVYSGDVNNNGVTSACNAPNESVTVTKVSPSISTQASAGNLLGAPVRDVATVAGGFGATGSVVFKLFSDTACANQVFSSTNPLTSSTTATSDWFTPAAAGTYYWTASYGGDANNFPASSACGAPNESVAISAFQAPTPTRTITGDLLGPVTVNNGESVLITGARVVGPVTVNPGGSLSVVNSQISRGITANAPAFLSLCGTQVSGPSPGVALSVANAPVPIRIGDPANGCAGNRFAGDVNLTSNLAVTFGANIVSNNVTINTNGPGSTAIRANNINQALNCTGNNPAPTNAGQTNTAGSKTGQCAGL